MGDRREVPPSTHWLHFLSREGGEITFGSGGDTQPQSDEGQKKEGVSEPSPDLKAVEAEKHEIG